MPLQTTQMTASGVSTSLAGVHTQPLFEFLLAIPAFLGFQSITSASPMCQAEFPRLVAVQGDKGLNSLNTSLVGSKGLYPAAGK